MERAVEWFVAITSLVMGVSHIVCAADWVEAYGRLHLRGQPGALASGALSLLAGAAIVSGHPSWAWPSGVITAFGWLLVAKGVVSLLAPQKALRSMELGRSPRRFVAAGVILLAVSAWAGYCLWLGPAVA